MTKPMIRSLEGHTPEIADGVFVAPGAVVLGRVRIGPGSSVWYGCVLRAEAEEIRIGEDCNVQDGSIMHADPGDPTVLGDRVTVGHGAIVHGATIDDDVLIGMRSVVLNGAKIGSGSLVAAGAVVRPGTEAGPGSFLVGVPARVREADDPSLGTMIEEAAREYLHLSEVHAALWGGGEAG